MISTLSFLRSGIGHLVGLSVGLAMLMGALIGWGWGVPYYSALAYDVTSAANALAFSTWSHKVRFLGAGAIGVSAIWTLLKLVKPVTSGLAGAMAASRARKAGKTDTLPITERDIPIGIVALVTLVCMLPIAGFSDISATSAVSVRHLTTLIIGGVTYIVLMSFLVSAVCGLHGWSDRIVEQSAVWHWNSGGDWRGVAARIRRETARVAGLGQSANGIRAFHYGGDLQRCRNCEQ